MPTPGHQKGQTAAEQGRPKPHSNDWTTRQEIGKGWNTGGGK
jgi:hypothetical protein